MWRVLYFPSCQDNTAYLEYLLKFKQIVPASSNISLLNAADEY